MIDYSREPRSDIAFVDIKSFYASVECVKRNLNPLNTSLCVMSRADNSEGLILASSPLFKKVFGKKNVGRSRDLPFDITSRKFNYKKARMDGIEITREYVDHIEKWASSTLIVPPRMALYIEENIKIQKIFQNFAPPSHIYPYSIDEGFLDLSGTLDYFIKSKSISRREKLDLVCAKIQNNILNETGLYSTIGMSNANPLLAKLALDNEAKNTFTMRANWSYEDVEKKVWKIRKLTDFWGIGKRMEKRLNDLHIYSIYDLAHINPDILKRKLGVMGLQLWFHAHGVDESNISKPYKAKNKNIGNSQVLPKDYSNIGDIKIVLSEIAEQVAVRLKKINKLTKTISIYIGYSYKENKSSIHAQKTISPTNSIHNICREVLNLFSEKYEGGSVRNLGVSCSNITDKIPLNLSLFEDVNKLKKQENLEDAILEIREKYGYTSIQKLTALTENSRVMARNQLIGGHTKGV